MTLHDASDLPVPPRVDQLRVKCSVGGMDIPVPVQHMKQSDGGVWLRGMLLPADSDIGSPEPDSDLTLRFAASVKVGSKFTPLPPEEVVLQFMGGVPATIALEEHNLDVKIVPRAPIVGTLRVLDSLARPFRGLESQLSLQLSAVGACDGGGPWEKHEGVLRLEGLTARLDSGKTGSVSFQCVLLDTRQRTSGGRPQRQIKGPLCKVDIQAVSLALSFHQEKGALTKGNNGEYVLEYQGRRFGDVVLRTVDESGHPRDLSHLDVHTATLQPLSKAGRAEKSHDVAVSKGRSKSISQYLDITRTRQYRAKFGDLTAELLVVVDPGLLPHPPPQRRPTATPPTDHSAHGTRQRPLRSSAQRNQRAR
jgi:hypothetical protein